MGGRTLLLGTSDGLERGPRLLLLQPNIPQKLKNSGAAGAEALDRHVELADRADARKSCDLIVWSETLLPELWRDHDGVVAGEPPSFTHYRATWREAVRRDMSVRYGKPLLAGAVTIRAPKFDATTPIGNSALLFDAEGRIHAAYDKRIRVPGGEYVPWIDHFSEATAETIRAQIREMAGGVPNVLAGTRSGALDLATVGLQAKAGVTICYEIAYPQLGRELVAEGAEWLINLSNEAWFPDSAEFEQYSAMAVVRAVEVRRTVVRCANSGTSGWIDPWGRPTWLEEGGRRDGFAGTLVVAPPIAKGTTPYVSWGDAFAWVICGAAVVAAFVRGQGEERSLTPSSPRPPARPPVGSTVGR
jgi:apolipoprotein N-acyltransferase